jgi:HEAT repeat protein
MNFPASRLAGLALLALTATLPASAHGGTFRGPLGPGAGGGGGAIGPRPLGPTGPAGPATPGVLTPGGGTPGGPAADLTRWELWWLQNQAPYLALKEHVHSSGADSGVDGWFLGEGQKAQRVSLRPTEDQIRKLVVPALLRVLERETNNDLVSGAMVALAKIGDGGDAAAGERFEAAIARFLTDGSQETRETAAVALGILASPRSIPTLAHLLWSTDQGRKMVRTNEVDNRTRAFAAYGLGLVGARTQSEIDRQLIVSVLRRGLEGDDTKTRDLEVACVIALGLVPLATIEAPPAPAPAARRAPPESSRLAQLDYVLSILRDERREWLARAQCPVTLARLLVGLPEPHRARYRAEIAGELVALVERERDRAEVLQSCVLALGQIGTNDGKDPLDQRIRRALVNVTRFFGEPQARAFALVAAAEAGARYGSDPLGEGVGDAREFLLDQLANGKHWLQPWAALACGVLGRNLEQRSPTHAVLETLRRVLRVALEDERVHERLGAYALAAGLTGSADSAPRLMKLLAKELPDEVRGQVALGLALLGHLEAVEPLREIVARSKYRPELLRLAAIALGILGEKDIGPQLAAMLAEARSLAAQSAIASALGFIGDRGSVEPLLALLESRVATEQARAFAAVALGNVADKEPLPWNTKIGFGLNYRAAPSTLSDPLTGTGILDIF